MRIHAQSAAAAVAAALLLCACSQPVLKQDIPVTTNPLGARILANGTPVGTTPATVSLERNRSHILTLIKENYRQEDVVIERLYQKDKTYLKAIQSGVHSGLFHKNPAMGIQSSLSSLSSQEETGEAFILSPQAVKVTLTPVAGTAGASGAAAVVPAPAQRSEEQGTAPKSAAGAGEAPPMAKGEFARELLKTGAGAAASQMRPFEKTVETSSSSRSYVKPDGTRVTEQSSTSVGAMVEKIMEEFGRIDVLVNNAGIVKAALFVKTTEEEWDRIVATNLKGVFNCCKHVVPHMIAQRGGRIINISSLIALSGYRGNAAYSSSKAAILALTGTLAQELGRYEIRVNAVLPGHFHTEMTQELGVSENEWQRILTRMPLGRFGKEEELADVVRFLAFRGDYVSGVALRVDGGWNP